MGVGLNYSAQPRAAVLHGFLIRFLMRFYRRNLPHIEKDGATYFITFSTRNYFVLPDEARSIVFDHCLFENGKRVQLHAAVVMPDHVHLLMTPLHDERGEPHRLAQIMNSVKGASAHNVNKLLRRKGSLWLAESFDRIMRSDDQLGERILYIVENPIAAGL